MTSMTLVAIVLLLPDLVHGFRDAHGTVTRHGTRFLGNCRSSKCDNQSHTLRGDVEGTLHFQDCQVKEKEPFYRRDVKMCEETCTVLYSNVSTQVKVIRPSGHGPQKCSLPLQEGICEDKCCVAKCSGESYEFTRSYKGKHEFRACQINKDPVYFHEVHQYWCQESCKVHGTWGRGTFQVLRQSKSQDLQCQPAEQSLLDMSMDFVEQLEYQALPLTRGNYGELPIMKARTIGHFLRSISSSLLEPEMEKAGDFGYTRQISEEVRHVAILGDLHGQLWNLIAHLGKIKEELKDKGLKDLEGSGLLICDPKMRYVFMGDYVDRGERGVELLLLLLAYKARCPESVILLQGNHEDERVWERYGFAKELAYKFRRGLSTSTVANVMRLLPYVAVAPGRWMAMHGGISQDMVRVCTGKGGNFSDCLGNYVGDTTVWVDPHSTTGWIPSRRGGQIFDFGMDIAKAFLESNNLKGIFRGHEQVSKGYTEFREGDYFVATVFSAADYVGVFCEGRIPSFDMEMFSSSGVGNLGAFVLEEVTKDSTNSTFQIVRMSGKETRAFAAKFTGAQCPASLLETGHPSLERFMQENHRRLNLTEVSCSLGQQEAAQHQKEVHALLSSSSNVEFEARKLIDLEGEDLINGEALELCKSMKKDHITLQVYKELHGPDEEILEKDIEIRKEELE